MKKETFTLILYSIAIWLIASTINAWILALFVTGTLHGHFIEPFFALTLLSALFSIPVLIVVQLVLSRDFEDAVTPSATLKNLMIAATVTTLVITLCLKAGLHSLGDEILNCLFISGPVSGILALAILYRPIKKFFHRFQPSQEGAPTG